jgi:ATP-binding cassette subfamily F protein 3
MSVLSGGEKSRVALLKLLLFPSNLLVLDEPTNHLDLRSKDVLLDALNAFTGTLIFVSHDRYFIESLAGSVLELGPSGPRLFPGDYDYYLWKTAKDSEPTQPQPTGPLGKSNSPTNEAASGADERPKRNVGQKRLKTLMRKLQREQEELLGKIEELESTHRRLSARLALPEVYTDGEKVKQAKEDLERNIAEQQRLSKRWEEVEAELAAAADR